MARGFSDDLRELARIPGTFRESYLKPAKIDNERLSSVGSGSLRIPPTSLVAAGNRFYELVVIYSEILLQEGGAFELPPGWPDANTYDTDPEPASNLRPVLYDSNMIQRRVHAYGYRDANFQFYESHLLTDFCKPFAGQGKIYLGNDSSTWIWVPTFKSYQIVALDDNNVDQRVIDFIVQMRGYYNAV